MALKYNDLCINIRRHLISCGDGNPSMTAQELVRAASGKSREQLLRDYPLYAPEEVARAAVDLCRRRMKGEPLAYILGQWDFMGMTLSVTPEVLIPRDDTEIAATLAIQAAEGLEEPHVLDLCCGSGCIGLAVAKNVPRARVVMADISDGALKISHKNAQSLGFSNRAISVRGDALEEPPAFFGGFDVLVSNPPYITSAEMQELDSSVKDYEPSLALHGGTDGLDFYRSITEKWLEALKPGGKVIFEVGAGQAPAVMKLLAAAGCTVLGVARDSGGIDRAVMAEKPDITDEEEVNETDESSQQTKGEN